MKVLYKNIMHISLYIIIQSVPTTASNYRVKTMSTLQQAQNKENEELRKLKEKRFNASLKPKTELPQYIDEEKITDIIEQLLQEATEIGINEKDFNPYDFLKNKSYLHEDTNYIKQIEEYLSIENCGTLTTLLNKCYNDGFDSKFKIFQANRR